MIRPKERRHVRRHLRSAAQARPVAVLSRHRRPPALLETIDGFISVERFGSLTTEGKYVSLSFWRDEAAVIAWRQQAEHHLAQARGRDEIFADYRIRVAKVVRDYGMFARADAPQV